VRDRGAAHSPRRGPDLRRRRVSTVSPLIVYRKEKKRRRSSASVPASSAFLEQRSSRFFLLSVIRRILGLKGVAVRLSFYGVVLIAPGSSAGPLLDVRDLDSLQPLSSIGSHPPFEGGVYLASFL